MKGGIDLHVWEETGDSTHPPPYLLVHENIPGGAKTSYDKQKAIEERAKAKAMLQKWAKDVAAMNRRRTVLQSEFRNKRCVLSNVLTLTL